MFYLSLLGKSTLKKIPGPILIFGTGGFIGSYCLATLLNYRNDVYGVTRSKKNWRFKVTGIKSSHLIVADVHDSAAMKRLVGRLNPGTIWNFSAYGAYSSQKNVEQIYQTNILGTANILEACMHMKNFPIYLHAGTSSEYGQNSAQPHEDEALVPNSHYSISKVANSCQAVYYGKFLNKPVAHVRIYSAYGPLEESTRLIPRLVQLARHGKYVPFVDAQISRDYVYVQDVLEFYVHLTTHLTPDIYGEIFNLGTTFKTTMRQLALLAKKLFRLKSNPVFGTMHSRDWDTKDWYASMKKTRKILHWKASTHLSEGLKMTRDWQKLVHYDSLFPL